MSAVATHSVDVAVIGGGIIGLAAARALLDRQANLRVVVLEKEPVLAAHQSSRNSGVVHTGIYYQPGSLKARLCIEGRTRLRAYALAKGLPYRECGKLIIAVNEAELAGLDELERRAFANEVPGVRRVGAREIRELEPAASGIAALHSQFTAITDYAAVARAFARDIEDSGGQVRCGYEVVRITQDADTVNVYSASDTVKANHVLVCAGLHSDRLATLAGDSPDPTIIPFRGDYYRLRSDRTSLVRGLIYPVPNPDLPFLGIHLTPTVGGDVLVGPNAVLAAAREGYGTAAVRAADIWSTLRWPGFWRFASQHWRTGIDEVRRAGSKRLFAAHASAYVPVLRADDLRRARAGVRAQAITRAGTMVDDFQISRVGRVVNVRNAPSPAATASLPIADEIINRLDW